MPQNKKNIKNTNNKKNKKEKAIEDIYKRKDPRIHVLDLPDTYIGGIEEDDSKMWVYHHNRMVYKVIKYIPGLYKIFDEIAVNARDHSIKDSTCKNIKIDINEETGVISCMNDGQNGIPVAIHEQEKMYVPEMIFGVLLTSGNYDEDKKITGGKNGW